ncbi:hypothetical protein J3458_018960 [Metarhizium acridum]|uniref:Glycolipid 2-alpha-mannosyltransferase n=1 Tax=Metarhizium acridum (strain CQMa 102) TaxID=655827 RepID=E9DWE1_METAQ|nr:uncharacterized protein MAC_01939 [Metarhizium acridum CQMa 102]EFY91991.1 hypothetical protein MAC_01939 [Metarhizium acridum CQMa 102]KAG8409880.1 hypothetical protein J3458_018960 [Metarhizium acridum]
MADLNIPIAVRRTRRSNVGIVKPEETESPALPPKTPRRARKAVRFSDPGISMSSGLTPMINRTSINTPRQRRRASTPAISTRSGTPGPQNPIFLSHNHHQSSHPLHHTIDGRVERRVRRNNLRDLLNKLEQEKKRKAQQSQAEISHLKSEIKSRDREIYELQNATIVVDNERIWDLEQQIENLKDELAKRPETPHHHTRSYNWTLAARDPFADEYTDMAMDEDQFGDATMAHLVTSTPSRARSSFPTPPATSPMLPSTPCSSRPCLPTPRSHMGVQVCFPDVEKRQAEEELASLQLEVCKLTATLDSYRNLSSKLKEKLASVESISPRSDGDSAADVLEGKIEALLQNMSDRTEAVRQLSAAIADLGFPGADASEMIIALSSGFRAARLELEYLTPGEIALPLTSHGAEVLDLLLTRLRELAKKAKEDESSIDEYHELEQSLRKQLDARVSVMDDLKSEMAKAERLLHEKNLKVQELEIGNERLKGAVGGYIRDMSELEKLVQRMEQEHREACATHSAQREFDRQELAKRDASISELQERLADAVRQSANLQKEISDVQDSSTRHVVSLNKRHGAALALRDARVLELRGEIDRVNDSLRAAHETIRVLRVDKGSLQSRMEDERDKAKAAMDSMKAELQRVLQMSHEFLSSPGRAEKQVYLRDEAEDELASSPSCVDGKAVAAASDSLVPTTSAKKLRRRYDSGLGLLEEDDVEML